MMRKIVAFAVFGVFALTGATDGVAAESKTHAAIIDIADFVMKYAITLAALGVLTMALLEAVKKLCGLQGIFQQRALRRWIDNDAGRAAGRMMNRTHYRAARCDVERPPDGEGHSAASRVYAQLMALATGVDLSEVAERTDAEPTLWSSLIGQYRRSIDQAIFELELDRLMAQIQDAADTALNYPDLYPDLFAFLTRAARTDDVEAWRGDVQPRDTPLDSEAARKAVADRYARIRQAVRRHLDSFQIVTAQRWRDWNQFYAIVVGAVLLFVAQVIAATTINSGTEFVSISICGGKEWTPVVLTSVLGGMLAPVASDLVSALSKLKKHV